MMKIDLSSTSASVLLWTNGEIHASHFAQKFLGMLNLDSGLELLEQCEKFWPHYSEILKNRKSCILDLTKNNISNNDIEQIVIIGAGLDALSLEICSYSKKCKVFEIDAKNMDVKRELVRNVHPSLGDSISCIGLDLSESDKMIPSLIKHGWNKNIPSLLIIEGLSYYLPKQLLWEIIGEFRSEKQNNHVVLEYLLPIKKIPNKWLEIAEYPFSLISQDANLSFITRYDIESIMTHLQNIDAKLLCHHQMKTMEKKRTSQNAIFGKQEGWIEICEILI